MAFKFWKCCLFVSMAFFICLASSCRDSSKEKEILFKAFDEGFVNSNQLIMIQNEEAYRSLGEKTLDPATAEAAKRWFPKAKVLQAYTEETYKFIDGLKR